MAYFGTNTIGAGSSQLSIKALCEISPSLCTQIPFPVFSTAFDHLVIMRAFITH